MGSDASLPDQVRETAREVAARAQYVTIDHDAMRSYAQTLRVPNAASPTLEPGDLPDTPGDSRAAWVLTVNAVNFGSGFFPVLRKRPYRSGSMTIFRALRQRFETEGPLTAADLLAATPESCAELFGQDPDGPAAELMAWFAASWYSLGEALTKRWDGSFDALIADAGGSAVRLAEILAGLDGWRDVSSHDGAVVPLYKRAQIAPAHLAMAFGGAGLGAFTDLDQLTLFADNLVPHVLRIDGVLRFDTALVDRIDGGELLVHGSPEEVEIRAVAVHAVELLVTELRTTGLAATAMGLDQVLWRRGAERRYKDHPRHRSRTTAY